MKIGEFSIGHDKPETRAENFDFTDVEFAVDQREKPRTNADSFDACDRASAVVGIDDDVFEIDRERPRLHRHAVPSSDTEFARNERRSFASGPCANGAKTNQYTERKRDCADDSEDDAERDREHTSAISAYGPSRASVRRCAPFVHGLGAYLSAMRRGGDGRVMCGLALRREKILKHA